MSSFVRKGGIPATEAGTRPGLAGQTLISTGHADMDRLLGGGLPLGSLTLIIEDGWSQNHLTLLRYLLGEGAACNQKTLLAASTEPEGGIHSFLPKLLDPIAAEKEKEAKKKGKEEDAVQLKIAWQYGRYLKPSPESSSSGGGLGSLSTGGSGGTILQSTGLQQQRNNLQNRPPPGRDWCHAFDLSKSNAAVGGGGGSGPVNSGGDGDSISAKAASVPSVESTLEFILCSGSGGANTNTASAPREKLISAIAAFITSTTSTSSSSSTTPQSKEKSTTSTVSRIAVLSLGDAAWNIGGTNGIGSVAARRSAIQSLIQLKAIVRDTKSCAIVTVPGSIYTESDKRRMAHIADVVLALEAVRDDSDIVKLAPDPSSVTGLLHLQKLASMGSIAAPAPQNPLYLVRSKRRRMAITPVEIDPDAEEAAGAAGGAGLVGGGGGGGGGRTPASTLLCGGPSKGKPDLEF